MVHQFDLAAGGVLTRSFSGHQEYVHAVMVPAAASGPSKLPSRAAHYDAASASEDGSVRLWDVRQAEAAAVLVPEAVPELARPKVGKFLTVSFQPRVRKFSRRVLLFESQE